MTDHYSEQREADEKQKCCYEYGVEYPTNGQKPDLPDDVVVDIKMHADDEMSGSSPVSQWAWGHKACYSFRIVDERCKPKQHQNAQDELKPQNPYQHTIIGFDGSKCVVDVYRVLDAFKTDSPALDHAIKKILCPGTRHAKTREQDLKEAIKSIEAELLLMSQR